MKFILLRIPLFSLLTFFFYSAVSSIFCMTDLFFLILSLKTLFLFPHLLLLLLLLLLLYYYFFIVSFVTLHPEV